MLERDGGGGYFFTGGSGIGAEAGATLAAGVYDSLADLNGVNLNTSVSTLAASGSFNFTEDGRLVGGSYSPGAELGASVTRTTTYLFGCNP